MEKLATCLASILNVNLDDSNVAMGVKSPEKADLWLQSHFFQENLVPRGGPGC